SISSVCFASVDSPLMSPSFAKMSEAMRTLLWICRHFRHGSVHIVRLNNASLPDRFQIQEFQICDKAVQLLDRHALLQLFEPVQHEPNFGRRRPCSCLRLAGHCEPKESAVRHQVERPSRLRRAGLKRAWANRTGLQTANANGSLY